MIMPVVTNLYFIFFLLFLADRLQLQLKLKAIVHVPYTIDDLFADKRMGALLIEKVLSAHTELCTNIEMCILFKEPQR